MQRMKKMTVGALVAAALALSACATLSMSAKTKLQPDGLSAARVSVDGDKSIEIMNSDAKPHQIYSHDCPALSSAVLEPGQSFVAFLGEGPKTCHYQDLLNPEASSFQGTVEVRPSTRSPITWYGGAHSASIH